MCKTEKNARNDITSSVSFNTARQIVQRKPRNWIYINELIDFGGQNETKHNRISFLVLLRLTFKKTTENKSKNSYVEIKLKARNKIIYFPHEKILLQLKRDESGQSNLFRDQSYFNCVVSAHLFLFSFVL